MPRKTQWRLYVICLLISDILALWAALKLGYWLRFSAGLSIFDSRAIISITFYNLLILGLIPLWLIVFALKGLYKEDKLLGSAREYPDLFTATFLGMAMVVAIGFIFPTFVFARGWLLMAWGLSYILPLLGRLLIKRSIYFLRPMGYLLRPTIIIGANDEGKLIAEQLINWRKSGFYIIGFVDKKIDQGTKVIGELTCLGDMKHLEEIIERYDIKELILATSAITSRDKMVEIFKQYGVNSDIKVRLSSGLYEIITTGLSVSQYSYVPLVTVNPVRLTGTDVAFKTLMDYTIVLIGGVLLSPVLMLIAILVKIDSPGPIIHRRRVVGVNGKEFDAFKFRTMYVDSDKILEFHPELKVKLELDHKLKVDPRITRLGKYLRKYSLDELPQILNVLKGEMSLVGPRMITRSEMSKYDKLDLNLLTVRPGITGLWQVSGRSDVSYEERVRLDMYYIRNWNIWLDISLLIQTIPAVISKRGAY
jgi:exopolysaccharide biosynthesis polyprenyl glycosylphosphotransferase